MSATPRTDAARLKATHVFVDACDTPGMGVVPAAIAGDLERELAKANRQLSVAYRALSAIRDRHDGMQDVRDGADGPKPNVHMLTCDDCDKAIAVLTGEAE